MKKLIFIFILLFPVLVFGQRDINGRRITGKIKLYSGTASLPSYSFFLDSNSGIYRIGADSLGLTVNGTLVARIIDGVFEPVKIKNDTLEKDITVSIFDPNSASVDTFYIFNNNENNPIQLDSIYVESDVDDDTIFAIMSDKYGANITVIDTFITSTDGTNNYYTAVAQASLDNDTLAVDDKLGFVKASTASYTRWLIQTSITFIRNK